MKLLPKFNLRERLIKRNNIPIEELDPMKCENCRTEFIGHFCPNCGQEVAEFNRPLGFVIYDFMGNFFAFDTRFFQTFKHLLVKPGFLTTEFFAGRRVRYSPPFRIFVFLSFILFLLAQIYTERSLDELPDEKVTESSNSAKFNSLIVINNDTIVESVPSKNSMQGTDKDTVVASDSFQLGSISVQDSLVKNNIIGTDSLSFLDEDEDEEEDDDDDIDLSIFGSGKVRDNLNKLADQYDNKLKKTDDPEKRKKLSTKISMCRTPEMAISTLMKYFSWVFFILLPVFALLLKLFYLRRKQFYIRHLIFSIHLHSYLFFILIIIVCLNLTFASGLTTINSLLLLSVPVYLILALRKFYGQGMGKILVKFIGIGIIYNILLWSAVIYVFNETLNLS